MNEPMTTLIVTNRAAFWESFLAVFESHDSRMVMAGSVEESLMSLRTHKAALVVFDLGMDASALRHAVFQVLTINAMIHTAAVSALSAEEFHEAMEGLGMLASLP
ncbi:MAG: hypothetical protein ACI4P0_06540, partial [Mailhella sp.]